MKKTSPESTGRLARLHFSIATCAVLFLMILAGALHLLVRSDPIFEWTVKEREEIDRRKKSRYSYEHYFVDFEDRLINEELPSADYSRGGVYLMGTSNLKWASRFWELPEELRKLIRNYGIGATSHTFQFHFLQFLVEQQKMLSAGGDKSMVIFGLSYHNVGPEYSPQEFFPSLWGRHGLYEYNPGSGIKVLQTNPFRRFIHFERVRIKGFVRSLASIGAHRIGYGSHVRVHRPEKYIQERTEGMGTNWEERMRRQVVQFEAMSNYLQSRDVRVMVVFLPTGTWDSRMPFQTAYIDMISEVCRKNNIQVEDWSKLLSDDDFADSNHFTPSGVDKLHPRFVDIALSFLRSVGTCQ